MRKTFVLAAVTLVISCALPAAARAECKRSPKPPSQASSEDPGSLGPLHDSVTLDCLKYVGSIQMSGTKQVLIQDEKGTIHHLKVGDPMGENGGVISRIDESAIYITQRVPGGKGKRKEAVVKFPKKPD